MVSNQENRPSDTLGTEWLQYQQHWASRGNQSSISCAIACILQALPQYNFPLHWAVVSCPLVAGSEQLHLQQQQHTTRSHLESPRITCEFVASAILKNSQDHLVQRETSYHEACTHMYPSRPTHPHQTPHANTHKCKNSSKYMQGQTIKTWTWH